MRFWPYIMMLASIVGCGPAEEEDEPPVVIINNMNSANGSPNGMVNGSVNGTVNGAVVPDDLYPVVGLMQIGSAVTEDVDTLLSNTVEAIWYASEQTGTPTLRSPRRQRGTLPPYGRVHCGR